MLKTRVPLWMALAGCLGSLALGALPSVRAQAPGEAPQAKPGEPKPEEPTLSEYPYLPARYGEVHIPSVAEWQAMRLSALGASTTRITQEFSRQHLTCFPTRKGLVLTLDLLPEPEWKFYAGGGKFNAPVERVKPDIQKAVDVNIRFVRNFFSEVRDANVFIQVYMKSERIGAWENGKLTLAAEMPPK